MNANIIYTIFFFILPIRKSALLPLKIKMKESTVSPTVLFFMPFSHFLPSSSQQSHADPPIRADPDLPSRPHYQPRRRPSVLAWCGMAALEKRAGKTRKNGGLSRDWNLVLNTRFQGILSWESIRLSWRIMPVSVERPPFFLRFSPAFPPLP